MTRNFTKSLITQFYFNIVNLLFRLDFYTVVLGNSACWPPAAQHALREPSIHFRRIEMLHHGKATWPSRSFSARRRCSRAASRWRDRRDFCNNRIHAYRFWLAKTTCNMSLSSAMLVFQQLTANSALAPYRWTFCKVTYGRSRSFQSRPTPSSEACHS